MKKLLLSLAVLAASAFAATAETAEFDFSNPAAFGYTSETRNAGVDYDKPLVSGDVTITCDTKDAAANGGKLRFWWPQKEETPTDFRCSSGGGKKNQTLTFTADGATITKIEFSASKFALTANPGTLGAYADKAATWQGSATEVVFTTTEACTFNKITVTYGEPAEAPVIAGKGTYAEPWLITSAEDLCNAYKLVDGSRAINGDYKTAYYFKQTADIDMAGVTDWHALSGYDNKSFGYIRYDGDNHLIKNFAPADAPAEGDKYYCTSLFGCVPNAYIENLGMVDAKIKTTQDAGVLISCIKGGLPIYTTFIANVFVTGEVKGKGDYTGAMIGNSENGIWISESFANVKVTGRKYVGGLVGNAQYDINIDNAYVAGRVRTTGADITPYLVFSVEPESVSSVHYVSETPVIAFNTGSELAMPENVGFGDDDTSADEVVEIVIATPETKEDLIKEIQELDDFSATLMVKGYPGLDSFDYSAEPDPVLPVANTVAETVALADKADFEVGYDLTMAYVNGINAYAYTSTNDFILLYGSNDYKVGDVIIKGWEGQYNFYNGVPEIKPIDEFPDVTSNTEEEFVPAVVAAADIKAELVNHIVVVKNVLFNEATPDKTGVNFTGKVGDTSLAFYSKFKLDKQEAGTYDVTVAVSVFKEAVQLYPIAYKFIAALEPEKAEANNVAETKALEDGTIVTVNYALTVGFANNGNIFACDEAGDFIQVYYENATVTSFNAGDVIPAGWEASYKLYKGVTPELVVASVEALPAATEGTFTPKAVAAADITAAMVNSVVKVENVVFDEATKGTIYNFTGKVGETELAFRNNYTLESVPAGKYNVTVVVNVYQGNVQLYVVKYDAVSTDGIDEIEADAAEAVYYNLQGVEVKNPANGVYIVRRGAKVSKEFIR